MTPQKIRILVVDDHALFRAGVVALLAEEPEFEVVAQATTAEEGARLERVHRPDVVLMDLSMPGGSGLQAARSIAARKEAAKVLIVSMHDDPAYLRAAFDAGAAGYLVKRASELELGRAIRSVHGGRTYVDSTLAGAALRLSMADGATDKTVLSPREEQVLRLIATGYTYKEIGAALAISPKTVNTYRDRLADKLGLSSRAQLTRYAKQAGLLDEGVGSGL